MADLDQPCGNRRAHFTDAGNTQFHAALPSLARTALTRALLDHNLQHQHSAASAASAF
jgi:hypothetical protein